MKSVHGGLYGKSGFVGLGVMGSRMAKRLLEAGHDVTGYNALNRKRSGCWMRE
jgi:3-hydroxyisobutyrate dehydrogenase-like beta-hydroxyacid dehydrogenase